MAAEHGAVIQADGFCQRRRVIVAEALLCRLAQRPHGAVSSAQTQLFHQRRRVRENPANGFVYVLQLVFLFPALADQLSSEQQEQEQQKHDQKHPQHTQQHGFGDFGHGAAIRLRLLCPVLFGGRLLFRLGLRLGVVRISLVRVFLRLLFQHFAQSGSQLHGYPADPVLIDLRPRPRAAAVHGQRLVRLSICGHFFRNDIPFGVACRNSKIAQGHHRHRGILETRPLRRGQGQLHILRRSFLREAPAQERQRAGLCLRQGEIFPGAVARRGLVPVLPQQLRHAFRNLKVIAVHKAAVRAFRPPVLQHLRIIGGLQPRQGLLNAIFAAGYHGVPVRPLPVGGRAVLFQVFRR